MNDRGRDSGCALKERERERDPERELKVSGEKVANLFSFGRDQKS